MNVALPSSSRCSALPLLLCFSHLRWNFVYQRPQHLMSRFARHYRVLYVEEPVSDASDVPWLDVRDQQGGVQVLVPHLPAHCTGDEARQAQRRLLDGHLATLDACPSLLWYYTPMSLAMSAHLDADCVVYDCMDELSAFRGAPPHMLDAERMLLERADIVFTGGHSLYQAKSRLHANVYAFPSSVDTSHFAQARDVVDEPADQACIPRPRLGFHGVLDERLDTALLAQLADLRPDWHIVLIGPVVKIDANSLPHRPNIHYLGSKSYTSLPAYLAGWDVAIMPFARNESTRFISPTKTPEYLAGGRAVVSTPITDVVRTWGQCGMVSIADTAPAFMHAVVAELARCADRRALCKRADQILAGLSWDHTWQRMAGVLKTHRPEHRGRPSAQPSAPIRLSRATQDRPFWDYLIVGAGFAGSVLAERLAAGLGKRVLVIDRRDHIAGNAYDYHDDAGVLV